MDEFESSAEGAYSRAKAGGRHAGMLRRYDDMSTAQIEKSLRSLEENVVEHRAKVAHPEKYVFDWKEKDPREQRGILNFWGKDIVRNSEQAEITRKYLEEFRR